MKNSSVSKFLAIAASEEMKPWPMVLGSLVDGPSIPYFGGTIVYELTTGNGIEKYVSILRTFGWAVAFGVTKNMEVITLCQWKPGVNCASWELPPGGIGKIGPGTSLEEIQERTEASFLKETGYGNGSWTNLGNVMIETGKYRGAGPDEHGLPAHLFLATGLEEIQAARNPNPNVKIKTLMVPLENFMEVLDSGLFTEASAVPCAYKALIKLGALKY